MSTCHTSNGLIGVWNAVLPDLVGILVCLRFLAFQT